MPGGRTHNCAGKGARSTRTASSDRSSSTGFLRCGPMRYSGPGVGPVPFSRPQGWSRDRCDRSPRQEDLSALCVPKAAHWTPRGSASNRVRHPGGADIVRANLRLFFAVGGSHCRRGVLDKLGPNSHRPARAVRLHPRPPAPAPEPSERGRAGFPADGIAHPPPAVPARYAPPMAAQPQMAGAAAPLAGFAADAVAAALAAAAAAALPRRPPAEARAALRDFFARLLHPTAIATMRLAEPLSVAVLALHYLRRLRSADLGEASFFPHACSASRPQLLLLPLLIIANKYINDRTCSNRRWARWLRQDGLDGPAISRAERAALAALDHGLGCPSRDFDRLVADVRELAAAREALCPPRGRADPVRGYEPEALSPPLLPGETDRERTLAAAIREAAQLALERTGRRRPAPHPAIPALLPAWATAAPASALGKRTRPLMVEIPAFYARPAPLPSSHPLRAYIAQLPTQFPAQLPTPPITPASNPSPPDTSGPWPWLDARWALPDARSGFLFA